MIKESDGGSGPVDPGVSVVEAFWVRPQRIYVNTGNGM